MIRSLHPNSFALTFVCAFVVWFALACTPQPTPTLTQTATPSLVFATSTPPPTATLLPTATPTPIRAVVTDTLRVREEPNTDAVIVGRLKSGDVVYLYARSQDNQWFQIAFPLDSDQRAWVFSQVVVPDSNPNVLPLGEQAQPVVAPNQARGVTKDYLTVRSGPGTNYNVVGYFSVGREIIIIGQTPDGAWLQIQVPASFPPNAPKTAWVKAEFVQVGTSLDSVQVAPIPPTPAATNTPLAQLTPSAPPFPVGNGRVLLEANPDGAYDIYSIAESGNALRRLTTMNQAYGARYSPDGSRIAFYRLISSSANATTHLFVMNASGSNVVDLTSADNVSDSDPDWSPDGTHLVFIRTPRAGGPEIWIMNADGSNAHSVMALTPDSVLSFAETNDFSPRPRWSPDGARIAFAAVFRPSGAKVALFPSIYVMNVDGSGLIQLTDNDQINTGAVWSPDAKQIAWSAKDFINRQNWKVRVMNADGSAPRIVINSPDGDPDHAAQVAEWFAGRLLIAGWHGSWDAYWFSLANGKLQQFTFGPGDNRPTDWLP